MLLIRLVAFGLALAGSGAVADEDDLPAELEPFVLPGHEVLDSAEGDLDGDGRRDAVLILAGPAEVAEEDDMDTRRLLLLLVRQADGRLKEVRRNDGVVYCRTCGGILKSATISFGQALVEADLLRARDAAMRCDLMLAVGTTLSVYPAAGVVPVAKEAGARVVIVNAEPTAMDDLADAVVRGPISVVLPRLVEG